MDMIDRYLNAVAAQLPQDERADIVAELRDLILSRFEAKEEELGRALNEDEQEAILREIGHPLVVAARYRKGPDSLVGPELFPYWLFGVKAGLMVLGAVHAILLLLRLVGGPADAGQAIAQAFHSFFGSGLTLIGAATLAAAIFEHQGIRPSFLRNWRVKDLGAFGLSDPAAWGASMAGTKAANATWMPQRKAKAWPGGEYLFSFLAAGIFVLWWVGVLHFPPFSAIELRGQDAVVTAAPIWSTLFAPILVYALIQMSVDLNSVFRPHAVRLRALARIPIALVGLWLTWRISEAGHWFTLTRGEETARIAGDWSLLDLNILQALGDGGRDLAGVASTLSVVMVWALAISALSLICSIILNLWRLARG
ncbi:MAG: hypothetical protein KKE42_12230 [Alphaproteobacteria bacterium]|nr:hypothetical protein [Alphaproteobacteria bacterium]MBU4040920.1 hypothetical protein [Alphaproteobacteria bacterium]MBU4135375.1 hypothetical protein [Alphaproteobacteria bacterium]